MGDVEFVLVEDLNDKDLQQPVLLVSNEDVPLEEGFITGFYRMPSGQLIPKVKLINGKDNITFAIVLPRHEGLKSLLESMNYKERHKLLADTFRLHNKITKLFYKGDAM